MHAVGYVGSARVRTYAVAYSEIAGKVFVGELAGDRLPADAVESLLFFYDPEQATTEQILRLLEVLGKAGALIGMYPVPENASLPQPGELYRRGVLTGRGGRTSTFYGFAEQGSLPRGGKAWGREGWLEFVGAVSEAQNAVVVHTHGSAGCFALGGGALCARQSSSLLVKERCLPCQAGGECFRAPELSYLRADSISCPVVAFLSCLAVSFSDTIVAHNQTLVRHLLEGGRTAAVVTSFRVTPISSLECAFAEWLLVNGYSLGESVAALNEVNDCLLPAFVCLGDPTIRVAVPLSPPAPWRSAARKAKAGLLAGRDRDVGAWDELRAGARAIERALEDGDLAAATEGRRSLGAAMVAGKKSMRPESNGAAPAGQRALAGGGLQAFLSLIVGGLEPSPSVDASRKDPRYAAARCIATHASKTSTYIHGLWGALCSVTGESPRERHACGARLYTVRYSNQVIEECDFDMWVCVSCGVVGYTTSGEELPEVVACDDNVIVVRPSRAREFVVTAAVEPLRTIAAPPTDPVSCAEDEWQVKVPNTGAPGLNWIAILGLANESLACVRIPVIQGDSGWRPAYRFERAFKA